MIKARRSESARSLSTSGDQITSEFTDRAKNVPTTCLASNEQMFK